jgi:hypothetical protein
MKNKTLEIFKRKYANFVQNIGLVDKLFEGKIYISQSFPAFHKMAK